MDQIKIGQFIAQQRKNKKYTQRQLADILNISDKTISKWECGNGFPEISLLIPLCNELEISVNELLSGEKLEETNYKKKAEENMLNMIKEKEENLKKIRLTNSIGIISSISFLTLMIIISYYGSVFPLYVSIPIVIIGISIFIYGMYVAMEGERTIGYYECKNCKETFNPTFKEYTKAMHIFSTRRLTCPHCKKKNWNKKVYTK